MTTPDERPEDVLAEALRIVYGENNDRSVPLTDHQYGAAALLARLAARSYTLSKSAPDQDGETEPCPTCWQPVLVPQRGDHDYGISLRGATPPAEPAP